MECSEVGKVLINDIFAEFDGSNGIVKNIITDADYMLVNCTAKPKNYRRNYEEIYNNQVNQTLNR